MLDTNINWHTLLNLGWFHVCKCKDIFKDMLKDACSIFNIEHTNKQKRRNNCSNHKWFGIFIQTLLFEQSVKEEKI